MNLSVSTALHRFWLAAALPSASLLSLCLACTETSPPASADPPGPAGVQDLSVAADLTPPPPPPPDLMPPPTPMVLTGSFDAGSSPFRSWVATMEFAREIQATYKKPLRLTYFVTTAFYDTTVTGSAVGRAASRDEVLVRWALTQQALNEGHEVANHTVRHQDGGMWTAAQWQRAGEAYAAAARRAHGASQRTHEVECWQLAADAFEKAAAPEQAFEARCESIHSMIVVQGVTHANGVIESLLQTATSDHQRAAALTAKATAALARANALNAKGESLAEVSSAAYVAATQARAALAVSRAKQDEDAIKNAEGDRERARADVQAARADTARAQASSSRAEAQSARVQAMSAEQRAAGAQQQAAAAQQQAAAAQQQAANAGQQATASQQQAAAAGAQAAVSQQQMVDARAAAASAQQTSAQLAQQLKDMQARPTDRGMLVTLGDVLFEFGRADIKPGARDALRRLAVYLQGHPERRVLVEGFTDSVGAASANLSLSQRRADAVAGALAALNVSADRIRTQGYGEGYPVSDNANDTNRALNRRVEIYISDNDQPVRSRG